MSRKIIVSAATYDNSLLITCPRKIDLWSINYIYTSSATVGNRGMVTSFRMPTTNRRIAHTIITAGAVLPAATVLNIHCDIDFIAVVTGAAHGYLMHGLPRISVPAGGTILLSDINNIDAAGDTITSVVIRYEDGIIGPDTDPPVLS
jgi:hypothetical protein